MPLISVDGVDVSYGDVGEGASVMFVHGGAATSRYWDSVLANLSGDCRVITPDLYGCGGTGAWPGDSLYHDDEAGLVRAVIDTVGGQVHLIGHSYGASTCLRAAVSNLNCLASLVLIEPPMYQLLRQAGHDELFAQIRGFRGGFVELVEQGRQLDALELLVDRFSGSGTWVRMSERARKGLLKMVDALLEGFAANEHNPTTEHECQTVTVPTLLVCGSETGEPEKAMASVLELYLPNSRAAVVEGAYHQSPLSHPQAIAGLITEHVARSETHLRSD